MTGKADCMTCDYYEEGICKFKNVKMDKPYYNNEEIDHYHMGMKTCDYKKKEETTFDPSDW